MPMGMKTTTTRMTRHEEMERVKNATNLRTRRPRRELHRLGTIDLRHLHLICCLDRSDISLLHHHVLVIGGMDGSCGWSWSTDC